MKPAAILVSCMLAMVTAKPIMEEKRYYVTETVVETLTKTVMMGSRERTSHWRAPYWWPKSTESATAITVVPVSSTVSISVVPVASAVPSTTTTAPPAPPPSAAATTASTSTSPTILTTTQAASTLSSSSSTTQTPAPSPSSNPSGDSSYAQPILDQHNLHRDNHSAPGIVWSDSLAATAQKIAATCVYAHNLEMDGGGYGQNIGAGAPPDQINKMITDQMYNDEMMYYPVYGSEPDMSNFESWGHFSQIVWKETTDLGCYTQYCPNGMVNINSDSVAKYFTVCNYEPAGNMQGAYGANVGSPLGHPIIQL